MDEQAATHQKRLDRHHPTELCDVGESPTCFVGGVCLSDITAVSRFALWRQQNGSDYTRWFPVRQTCFPDSWKPPEGRPDVTAFTDIGIPDLFFNNL